jgi:hypothetical protein
MARAAVARLGWFWKAVSGMDVATGSACFIRRGELMLKRPDIAGSCASFAVPLDGTGEPNRTMAVSSHESKIAEPGTQVRHDHRRSDRRTRLTVARTASPSRRVTVASAARRNASGPHDRYAVQIAPRIRAR